MGLAGTTTRDDAERQVAAALDYGELAAQHAPAGHPIHAAVGRARQALELLQDEDASIQDTIAAGSELYDTIDRVIDGVFEAAALTRNVDSVPLNRPDVPLARTIFQTPANEIPWPLIAAGGGALLIGWYLFRRQGKRRRA